MKKLEATLLRALLLTAVSLLGQEGAIASELGPTPATVASTNTTGFTLRVIFYGLVAFVPNKDHTGMTALLVRATGHEGVIGTLDDVICEGENCTSDTQLIWRLDDDTLRGRQFLLTLDGVLSIKNRAKFNLCPKNPLSGHPEKMNNPKGFDLKWVPCMKHIYPDGQYVNPRCLDDLYSCTAKASLSFVDVQTAKVCHFSHTDDFDDRSVKKYGLFNFEKRGDRSRKGSARVVGDAVLVELEVAKEVTLSAIDQDPKDDSRTNLHASLKPANGGPYVTLVISNNHMDPDVTTTVHEHFDHYYDLSSQNVPAGERFRPQVAEPPVVDYGSACEQDLIKFEEQILGIKDLINGQHNQRECDTVAFSGK